jgi:uncharacterized protein (TIGR00369 family)
MSSSGKRSAESRFTLSALMGPQDANTQGNVHGGVIMKMADEAGALVAMRHARVPVVTVAIDTMTFMEPIFLGHLVLCHAELTYVGRTSMEVRVEIIAEDPLSGASRTTNIAYLVYVALDRDGRPTPVPQLIYETEFERERAEEAKTRQGLRKQLRTQERNGQA